MKLILAAVIFTVSTSAFAQPKKMSPPPQPLRPANVTSTPSYMAPTSSQNEITGNLGLVGGAVHFGATYVKQLADYGFGGYFFYQTSKDKNNTAVVSAITAAGALVKLNVYENHSVRAYLAPGFGITMIKDAALDANGKKSDENLISPTFKMGAQFKVSPTAYVGLERMQFSNWLNDSLNNYAGPAEYYSVSASFQF